jgi:hypothetical protein
MAEPESEAWPGSLDENTCANREKKMISDGEEMRAAISADCSMN